MYALFTHGDERREQGNVRKAICNGARQRMVSITLPAIFQKVLVGTSPGWFSLQACSCNVSIIYRAGLCDQHNYWPCDSPRCEPPNDCILAAFWLQSGTQLLLVQAVGQNGKALWQVGLLYESLHPPVSRVVEALAVLLPGK